MAGLVKTVQLHSGSVMPAIGLGTYLASLDQITSSVDCALTAGYRHIDMAYSYGNEKGIGDALQSHIEKGLVKRKDVFLTTKIPAGKLGSLQETTDTVASSLEALKVKHVDMLLIHHPWGRRVDADGNIELLHQDLLEGWRGLETLVKEGMTKHIGLSNFNQLQIHRIWEAARIKPANLQLECHVYNQQKELRQFCNSRGIVVTAYAPFGAPERPDKYRDNDHVELLGDPEIQRIASQVGRTPGQVLLRFLIQLGLVPLPKSISPNRIVENLQVLDFQLDQAIMKRLKSMDCGMRYFRFNWAKEHPEYHPGVPF